jgi:soluble lytic murein transglycosylase-like protein
MCAGGDRGYDQAIAALAKTHGIDEPLLRALIAVESSGNPIAVRYEPQYRYTFQPLKYAKELGLSFTTEVALQRMSFGLLQVMGAVAREQGFDGSLLQLARDPVLALEHGMRRLLWCFTRFAKKAPAPRAFNEEAVAAYNAGSPRRKNDGSFVNQAYVDKVRLAYSKLAFLSA